MSQLTHHLVARSLSLTSTLGALASPLLLGACLGEEVNLGEGALPEPEPPSYSRCTESRTLAGPVVVHTQIELDELDGCHVIEGDLVVQPLFSPDLRPLHALQSVSGRLAFFDNERELRTPEEAGESRSVSNSWLGSFEGLESLEQVGGLIIDGSAAADLQPLSKLRWLTEGTLSLSANSIRDLAPLHDLQGIERLFVNGRDLESIADLEFSSTITTLEITGNNLGDLGGVRGVRRVSESVRIEATGLRDMSQFSSLEYAGQLLVVSNPHLEMLAGLESLTTVAGELAIQGNPVLEDLAGATGLRTAAVLAISNNPRLVRIPDFPNLALQSLAITFNDALTEVAEFSGLTPEYYSNGMGVSSDALSERDWLFYRVDTIYVSDNLALAHFAVSPGWQSAKLVDIANNPQLTSLTLGKLEAIDLLSITNNSSLSSVGIGTLATVDSLSVLDNPVLSQTTFDGVSTFERNLSGNADSGSM